MEHKDIPDAQLHEVKGAASAPIGRVLSANGDGTATFKSKIGWWDYNDTATAGTPIALTLANTYYDLTNNALGANTNTAYRLSTVANIWNTGTNRFDFTGLALGDVVEVRIDIDVTTTSANTAIRVDLELGVGQPGAFILPIVLPINIKTASTNKIVMSRKFYVGSSLIKDNPARIRAQADTTGATVRVNGWFVDVVKWG